MELKEGDKVQYVGSNPKLRQGYSGEELVVHELDRVNGRIDCIEKNGNWVSGLHAEELQPVSNSPSEPKQERIEHLSDEQIF